MGNKFKLETNLAKLELGCELLGLIDVLVLGDKFMHMWDTHQ